MVSGPILTQKTHVPAKKTHVSVLRYAITIKINIQVYVFSY